MTSPLDEILAALERTKPLWDVDCPESPDDEPIGWSGDEPMDVTFGDIRLCKKALAHIQKLRDDVPINDLRMAVYGGKQTQESNRIKHYAAKTLSDFVGGGDE